MSHVGLGRSRYSVTLKYERSSLKSPTTVPPTSLSTRCVAREADTAPRRQPSKSSRFASAETASTGGTAGATRPICKGLRGYSNTLTAAKGVFRTAPRCIITSKCSAPDGEFLKIRNKRHHCIKGNEALRELHSLAFPKRRG